MIELYPTSFDLGAFPSIKWVHWAGMSEFQKKLVVTNANGQLYSQFSSLAEYAMMAVVLFCQGFALIDTQQKG
jgi:hypothetical protein